MSMSDPERAALGDAIAITRKRRYGTKKAAYTAADVNAATWDKAEEGGSVRPDLLSRIVRLLFPETDGDWTLVPGIADPGDSKAPVAGFPTVGLVNELIDAVNDVQRRLGALEMKVEQVSANQESPDQIGMRVAAAAKRGRSSGKAQAERQDRDAQNPA